MQMDLDIIKCEKLSSSVAPSIDDNLNYLENLPDHSLKTISNDH